MKFRQISVLNLGLQSCNADRLELDVKFFPLLSQAVGGICGMNEEILISDDKSSLSIGFSSGGIHGGNGWIQWSVPIHTLSIMGLLILLLEFISLIWKDMFCLKYNECTLLRPTRFFFEKCWEEKEVLKFCWEQSWEGQLRL